MWSRDISLLPPIYHKVLKDYLIYGTISIDNRSRGAIKEKLLGYKLFKEYVKKVRVKPNVKGARLLFIVKCNVAAAMKRSLYYIYIHLCQETGDILYA